MSQTSTIQNASDGGATPYVSPAAEKEPLESCVSRVLNTHHLEISELRRLFAHTKSMIVFVGAGVSQGIDMPSWRDLLEKDVPEKARKAISGMLKKNQYAQAAKYLQFTLADNLMERLGIKLPGQLTPSELVVIAIQISARTNLSLGQSFETAHDLRKKLGSVLLQERIKKACGDDNLNGKKASDAMMKLPLLTEGPVVTTNFDCALEYLYEACGRPFEKVFVGAEMQGATEAVVEYQHVLIKLHGTWEEEQNRVFTKDEYVRAYGAMNLSRAKMDLDLPFLAFTMFAARRVLFIGSSLDADLTTAVLRTVRAKTRNSFHYAIVGTPSDADAQRKQRKRLDELGVNGIFYPPGRHDCVAPILRELITTGRPTTAQARLFNWTGGAAFLTAAVTLGLYQVFMGRALLALHAGIPILFGLSLVVLWTAWRFARITPAPSASDRLMPAFGFEMRGKNAWSRWLVWLCCIFFPIYVACHFARQQDKWPICRLADSKTGTPAAHINSPEYYRLYTFDWPRMMEPHYRWGTDNGIHAFPFIQPWLNRIMALAAAAAGLAYTTCVITGYGCSRKPEPVMFRPGKARSTQKEQPHD